MPSSSKPDHDRPIEAGNAQHLNQPDADIPSRAEVCPYCRRRVNGYRFPTDGGLLVETYHCVQHGDVVPFPRTTDTQSSLR